MSALGLGLIAADSYFKEGDARQVRDYEKAKRDAELSTLPDETAAKRSGYQDTVGLNQARAKLRPGATSNAVKEQNIKGIGLDRFSDRQGTVEDTNDMVAKIGKGTAQWGLEQQPLQQATQALQGASGLMMAQNDYKQLPEKLARAAMQGVLDQRGQSDVVLGTMGQLIGRQDKAAALDFANQIAKNGNLLPNTNGKQFTDILPVRGGPEGDGYNFVTSDGQTAFVPVQAIGGAMQKLKSGKYKFFVRNDGSIFAGDEGTGRGGIVQAGDPSIIKGRNAQHTPAEIQTMEYLVGQGVAKNTAQAWDMVRSSREKTRSDFVMDYVSKQSSLGADPSKLAEDAGKVYDALRRAPSGAASGQKPSNTLGTGTFDPAISSLIGIP